MMEENKTVEISGHIRELKIIFILAFLSPWILIFQMYSDFGIKGIGPLELSGVGFSVTALLGLLLFIRSPDIAMWISKVGFVRKLTSILYSLGAGLLFIFGLTSIIVSDGLAITPENDSELRYMDYRIAALQLVVYHELKQPFKSAMSDGKISEKEFLAIMNGKEILRSGKMILSKGIE